MTTNSPEFTIVLADEKGDQSKIFYYPHESRLVDEKGENVFPFAAKGVYPKPVTAISPEEPGKKTQRVRRLKIQLGLGCNMSCPYCLQGQEVSKASNTSTEDARKFLENLDKWLDPQDLTKIEFWGGEPLLYWHKIEVLAPTLRVRFPDARMGLVTNGTLLTPEMVYKMERWGFSIAISHDGPGQHVRGDDPLNIIGEPGSNEPIIGHLGIATAVAMLGSKGRLSFNAVLTPASYDPYAVVHWFKQRIPTARVNFEGVVHQYGDDANARFTEEQLNELTVLLATQIQLGLLKESRVVMTKMINFLESLQSMRPASVLGQKCGMDSEDSLAVDLFGNVTTCQNVGANGPHKIGHVAKFDQISLNTSWHWSKREECVACPVLQLCAGACMYQEGNQWVDSCNAEFAYNMGFFIAAISVLTKKQFVSLHGNMLRPKYKEQSNA